MIKTKHCKYCDEEGHTAFNCPKRPKNVLNTFGPYAQKMKKVRLEWFKLNPSDHAGYWYCWLCGKGIKKGEVELDHVLSRSRHPELRFELSNLKPSCHDCNTNKGSKEAVGFYGI
jgi:5-methylcytosine-specific restriction endonuclease McrA